jgi:hypothetical protein
MIWRRRKKLGATEPRWGRGRAGSGSIGNSASTWIKAFLKIRGCSRLWEYKCELDRRPEWPYFSKWMDVLFDHLCLRTL